MYSFFLLLLFLFSLLLNSSGWFLLAMSYINVRTLNKVKNNYNLKMLYITKFKALLIESLRNPSRVLTA